MTVWFSDRQRELLHASAEALDKGIDPFSRGFLTMHSVSLDEVMQLSSTLSIMIEGLLSAPDYIIGANLAAGAASVLGENAGNLAWISALGEEAERQLQK